MAVASTVEFQKLASWLNEDQIGHSVNTVIETPFGQRRLLYADWTASGRPLESIERFLHDEVLTSYGNVHSQVTHTARQTSMYREEARSIIASYLGATHEDAIIFAGNGATGAIERFISMMNSADWQVGGNEVVETRWKTFQCPACDGLQLKTESEATAHINSARHRLRTAKGAPCTANLTAPAPVACAGAAVNAVEGAETQCAEPPFLEVKGPFSSVKGSDLISQGEGTRSVVFLMDPALHHSALLPFKELRDRCVTTSSGNFWIRFRSILVPFDRQTGHLSLKELARTLISIRRAPGGKSETIFAILSGCDNIAGVKAHVGVMNALVHRYGGFTLWDMASALGHVEICLSPRGGLSDSHIDVAFFSPHKMLGGPGTPGILAIKRDMVSNSRAPGMPGGGTVRFVSQSKQLYALTTETREEAGTPSIVACIRSGLVFRLAALVPHCLTIAQELEYADFLLGRWSREKRIHFLGPICIPMLGKHKVMSQIQAFTARCAGALLCQRKACISFVVKYGNDLKQDSDPLCSVGPFVTHDYEGTEIKCYTNRQTVGGLFLHHGFVAALLNDLFGVQARPGCQCAGPLSQELLGMDLQVVAQYADLLEETGAEIFRPGFVRVSLNYSMSWDEVETIGAAVSWVAQFGWKLLPFYSFDVQTGEWHQRLRGNPDRLYRKWLSVMQVGRDADDKFKILFQKVKKAPVVEPEDQGPRRDPRKIVGAVALPGMGGAVDELKAAISKKQLRTRAAPVKAPEPKSTGGAPALWGAALRSKASALQDTQKAPPTPLETPKASVTDTPAPLSDKLQSGELPGSVEKPINTDKPGCSEKSASAEKRIFNRWPPALERSDSKVSNDGKTCEGPRRAISIRRIHSDGRETEGAASKPDGKSEHGEEERSADPESSTGEGRTPVTSSEAVGAAEPNAPGAELFEKHDDSAAASTQPSAEVVEVSSIPRLDAGAKPPGAAVESETTKPKVDSDVPSVVKEDETRQDPQAAELNLDLELFDERVVRPLTSAALFEKVPDELQAYYDLANSLVDAVTRGRDGPGRARPLTKQTIDPPLPKQGASLLWFALPSFAALSLGVTESTHKSSADSLPEVPADPKILWTGSVKPGTDETMSKSSPFEIKVFDPTDLPVLEVEVFFQQVDLLEKEHRRPSLNSVEPDQTVSAEAQIPSVSLPLPMCVEQLVGVAAQVEGDASNMTEASERLPAADELGSDGIGSPNSDRALTPRTLAIPKHLRKLVGQAIHEFSMINEGDKVLVAVSGGKDSLTLLHILRDMQRRSPVAFTLAAATVDPQAAEYNPKPLIPYMEGLDIPYHMLTYPILELAKTRLQKQSFCSFCARMKRGLLYSCMRKHGYNKLALGQHLDDLAETFLMSSFYNGRLGTMRANYKPHDQTLDIRVIRPLVFVRERDLAEFAQANKLPVISDNCPACFAAPTERLRVKYLLVAQEFEYPNTMGSILRAMRPLLTGDLTGQDLDEDESCPDDFCGTDCAVGLEGSSV